MIEAHTVDAWTRAASKTTITFRNASVLGGFAAPLFLWLAGVALVLSAARTAERTGRRAAAAAAVCRRGLEIFIVAFVFRLQAFVVSPGGPVISLLRIDILNIMGPAIVLAGVLWALTSTMAARVAVFAAGALMMAMATPIVRAASWVDSLPVWIQWYLRPAGEHTTFTALPWAGFVLAGAAVGSLIAAVRGDRAERRLHLWLSVAGASLVAVGVFTASRPSIYREASFWTSSPTWFAIRVGILMLALSAMYALGRTGSNSEQESDDETRTRKTNWWFRASVRSWQMPLATLGRSSLFVYWIHVELVYGYASWLWRGSLPLWGTALAFVAFAALMYAAVVGRDWLLACRSAIRPRVPLPTT